MKYTLESAKEVFLNRDLFLEDDQEYKSTKTKMDCYDSDGYKYSLCVGEVKDKRTIRFQPFGRHNPYTLENIRNFMKLNNLQSELLSTEKPKGEKDKMLFRCKCGNTFSLHFNHLLMTKKDKCNACSSKERGDERVYLTPDFVNEKIKPFGYKLIKTDNFDYRQCHIIDKDGYKYKAVYRNLIEGCTPIKFSKMNPYTIENMKLYIKENNLPITLLEKNGRELNIRGDYVTITCEDCGEPFQANWYQITACKRYRCQKCVKNKSGLEKAVEDYLIETGVLYEGQKRFNDCKAKRSLPFDFYLPDYNCAIEVNGSQHYYESPMFSRSLKEQQYYDNIKKDYCKDNNITFLEIPFWDIENNKDTYKKKIDNIINAKPI
nr:MAG TPA: restriction enzyme [Caudoviricetes sp.]